MVLSVCANVVICNFRSSEVIYVTRLMRCPHAGSHSNIMCTVGILSLIQSVDCSELQRSNIQWPLWLYIVVPSVL